METLLAWSGGKDSSMALERLKSDGHRVRALLTTLTKEFDRVSMHGVRRTLLQEQASSLGLPLEEVWIPKGASNAVYEAQMRDALLRYAEAGVERVAFGDIFLRDIREYREQRLGEIGMEALFPLWGSDTRRLADDFLGHGFAAISCCVDPRKLGKNFCGREYDRAFLQDLPEGVDPCGENGEFHTFVYSGPLFSRPVSFTKGEVVLRDGFYFADLVPLTENKPGRSSASQGRTSKRRPTRSASSPGPLRSAGSSTRSRFVPR